MPRFQEPFSMLGRMFNPSCELRHHQDSKASLPHLAQSALQIATVVLSRSKHFAYLYKKEALLQ